MAASHARDLDQETTAHERATAALLLGVVVAIAVALLMMATDLQQAFAESHVVEITPDDLPGGEALGDPATECNFFTSQQGLFPSLFGETLTPLQKLEGFPGNPAESFDVQTNSYRAWGVASSFQWSSLVPVTTVYVKTSEGGNVFIYYPVAVTSGTALFTPTFTTGSGGEEYRSISHVTFCGTTDGGGDDGTTDGTTDGGGDDGTTDGTTDGGGDDGTTDGTTDGGGDDAVQTGATVTNGTAGTPNIECGWLLPDNDGTGADNGFSEAGIGETGYGLDYGPDDSPELPLAGDECHADADLPEGTYGPALQNNPTTGSLIQVMPNAHDRCAFQVGTPPYESADHANDCLQWIELWMAVDEASPGNTLVLADVYHPDGTLKVNIVLERLQGPGTQGQHGQLCDFPAGMEEAATAATGQVTTAAFANMKWECREQSKSFFYGAFDLSKHQPWGQYRVDVTAETIGGGIASHALSFYVLPFTQLEKDFASVSFGSISAGSAIEPAHGFSQPAGDFIWDGVDNGVQKSTIRNVGNAGAVISIWFDPLCYTGTGDPTLLNCKDSVKRIDRFDAKFGAYQGSSAASTLIAYGYEWDGQPFPGNGTTSPFFAWDDATNEHRDPPDERTFYLGDADEAVLCPNQVGKIEFSLWTEGIRQGDYVGVQADGTLGGIHIESTGAVGVVSPGSPCATDNDSAEDPHKTGSAASGYPHLY